MLLKNEKANKLRARCFFLFLLLLSFLSPRSLDFFSFSSSLLKKQYIGRNLNYCM